MTCRQDDHQTRGRLGPTPRLALGALAVDAIALFRSIELWGHRSQTRTLLGSAAPPALPDREALRIPEDDALVAFADLDRHYQISIHSTDIKSCHRNRIAFPEHELTLFE